MGRISAWLAYGMVALLVGVVIIGVWIAAPNGSTSAQYTAGQGDPLVQSEPTATEIPPNEWVDPVPTYPIEDEPIQTQPIPDADEPYGFESIVDYAPYDQVEIGPAARRTDMFVLGRVVEVLPAEWTTPDGARPENPWQADHVEFTIITPVIVEVEEVFLSRDTSWKKGDFITIAAHGGAVDDDYVYTNALSQHFETGEIILVGLSDNPYLDKAITLIHETSRGHALNIELKWQVLDDGMAVFAHPSATREPLDEILVRLSDYVK